MTDAEPTVDERQYSIDVTQDEFARLYAAYALAYGMTFNDRDKALQDYLESEYERQVDTEHD